MKSFFASATLALIAAVLSVALTAVDSASAPSGRAAEFVVP